MHERETEKGGPAMCRRCGAGLTPGVDPFYVVNVEAFPDPTFTLLTCDDPEEFRREANRLLAEAEGLTDQELVDQVYRRLSFCLCGPCYGEWIENPTG